MVFKDRDISKRSSRLLNVLCPLTIPKKSFHTSRVDIMTRPARTTGLLLPRLAMMFSKMFQSFFWVPCGPCNAVSCAEPHCISNLFHLRALMSGRRQVFWGEQYCNPCAIQDYRLFGHQRTSVVVIGANTPQIKCNFAPSARLVDQQLWYPGFILNLRVASAQGQQGNQFPCNLYRAKYLGRAKDMNGESQLARQNLGKRHHRGRRRR